LLVLHQQFFFVIVGRLINNLVSGLIGFRPKGLITKKIFSFKPFLSAAVYYNKAKKIIN